MNKRILVICLEAVVILVRHGGTAWNSTRRLQGRTDIPLSDSGVEEAKRLSSALASAPISSVYCSPLARSRQTAEILAEPHILTPKPMDDLVEVNFGTWEGKTTDYLRENFPENFQTWMTRPTSARIPGSEELKAVQKRVLRCFTEIVRENDGKVAAMVGHGGVNRVLLLSLLGAELQSFWRLRQDNVCVNLIEVSGDVYRVSLLNSVAHLETNYVDLVNQAKSRL